MQPLDWATLSIMATIFTVAGTSAFWLASQFRRIEKIIYAEMDKHKREDDTQFRDHLTRIQRLELKEFGFTHSP